MAADTEPLPGVCPSRERLIRIATMIRDAERSSPVVGRRKRRGREAAVIPLPFRRETRGVAITFPARHGDDVDLAS